VAGPRIYTLFVYLTDVNEGGETEFPRLKKIKIKPKAGSAILWSNVIENFDGTFSTNQLTDHRGNPPRKNEEKIAMNFWIHARDFETPNIWGCTVSMV